MNKRFFLLFLPALILALFVSFAAAETMYVVTQSGDPLNVREKPVIRADTVIGCIPNRSPVDVISFDSSGWAKINFQNEFGDTVKAYVSSRYLSYDQHANFSSGKTKSPDPTAEPEKTKDTMMDDLNAELKTAKTVTSSISVLVRPSRASGRVNLRWVPNNKSRSIVTYPANKQLTVLAETANWYQVQDPENNNVGFVSKKLVIIMPKSAE